MKKTSNSNYLISPFSMETIRMKTHRLYPCSAQNLSAAVILSSLLMVLASGCDIASPELPLTTDIATLSTVEYDIGGFRSGSHVTGTITLTLPADLVTFKAGDVEFYLDSLRLYSQWAPPKPCMYSFSTSNFAQGAHLLYIAVYEEKPSMGMMNILKSPRIIFVTSAVFGQQTLPQ